MKITIDIKSFLILTLVFIFFTAMGTVSHEYGHIAVAKMFGFETNLHYSSMNYHPKGYLEDETLQALKSLRKEYTNTDYDSLPKEIKEKIKKYNQILQERYWNDLSNKGLFITIGGPLQTLLTGTLGLTLLLVRRKSIYQNGLKVFDWFSVFLSLFWLREIFNLVISVGREIITPNGSWFGGDEFHISQGLNIWSGAVPIISAILGLIISLYIIFEIVPREIRFIFILSGLVGGISGFILWMNVIGPKILP